MLENIISQYLSESQASEMRNPKFRVSDAGRCHLMRYWKRMGKPFSDLPDERRLRIFAVGHLFHRWLQDILQQKGVLEARELMVEDIHRVGHIDAIVKTPEGLILYDFKTVHSRKFHHRKENGMTDLHYAIQAYTYSTMLPFSVADIRIVFISKDDLCLEEVSVFQFPDIQEKTYQDWFLLLEAWEKQREPAPNPMPWECKYCWYRTACPHSRKEEQ